MRIQRRLLPRRIDFRCRLSMTPNGHTIAIGFKDRHIERRNVLLWNVDPLASK